MHSDSIARSEAEWAMARRRIGQEQLAIGTANGRGCNILDETLTLIDWTEIDRSLVEIYASAKGEPAWPPLALFRALLLGIWYDLSDVKLAEALADRASFRRFCGFSATESTPERTAFVRFRAVLVRNGLDRSLFAAITRQLEAKGVAVRTGTLVDATLIPSASIHHDGDARWAGHRRRKPVHGYKAHVATDEQAGLIRGVEVTTANVHDAAELDAVLPLEPGDVYGDSAFAGTASERVIKSRGGRPRAVHNGTWGGPDALAKLQAHNADVQRVRARIEKVFGTCKRSYGLRRMRWLGLAKAGLQVRLTAIAYNLRRSWRLLRPASA
jgi:transposase, IS5 family